MFPPCLLRSIARAAPGHASPLLLSPRWHRLGKIRGITSTSPIFQKDRPGLIKGLPRPALGEKNSAIPGTAGTAAATRSSAVFGESNLSTREQRQADWGIIKEMSTYLWPKVGFPRAISLPRSVDTECGIRTIGQFWCESPRGTLPGSSRGREGV